MEEPQKEPLAKAIVSIDWRKLGGYRHEAGSLLSALEVEGIRNHSQSDLILHLIASHHGWARPIFQTSAFSPDYSDAKCQVITQEAMLRWERLQRTLGWWGLAWLESLLKRADGIASAKEEFDDYQEEVES